MNDLEKKLLDLELENKQLKEMYGKLEKSHIERSFKYMAINQITKTIAKERDLRKLKSMIMDMLFEVALVKSGLCFELDHQENCFKLIETKGLDKDEFKIIEQLDLTPKKLGFMERAVLISVETLRENNIFPEIFEKIKTGYVLTFLTESEKFKSIFIVLGEKSFGEYTEVDTEFLTIIRGQVELFLEAAINTTLIEKKNKEVMEKNFNLSVLNNAIKLLNSTLESDKLYGYVRDMFSEIMRANKLIVLTSEISSPELFDSLSGEHVKVNNLSDIHNNGLIVVKKRGDNELADLMLNGEEIRDDEDCFVIPLEINNILLGVIAFKTYKANNISAEFLSTLQNQITVSLYNAALYTQAVTDGMTNLYLQTYFKERVDQELKVLEQVTRGFSLIMIDIDHFKKFNDSYGHLLGDKVIKMVAKKIRETVREYDIVSRYGGEEFAVMLSGTTPETVLKIAEKIRKAIEDMKIDYKDKKLNVTISLGICHSFNLNNSMNSNCLIEKADLALYFSKEHGRNKVTVYSDEVEKEMDDRKKCKECY